MSSLFQSNNPALEEIRLQGQVVSQVGSPCSLAPAHKLPMELIKDEQYDEWTVPFSMSTDVITLFRLFGLWQSSNGLLKEGRKVRSMRRSLTTAITIEPVLVGDFLDGQQVIESITKSYDIKNKTYTVQVKHGKPPKAITLEPITYQYYASILHSDRVQSEQVAKLMSDFFEKVLPLVQSPAGPLITAPAKATFLPLMESFKQKTEEAHADQEEKTWML
jgi:hypothetical protein